MADSITTNEIQCVDTLLFCKISYNKSKVLHTFFIMRWTTYTREKYNKIKSFWAYWWIDWFLV